MKNWPFRFLLSLALIFCAAGTRGRQPSFKVLAFYSTKVEPDHVLFAEGALKFLSEIAAKNNFTFASTSDWDDMNDANLAKYELVVWLNDAPSKTAQKRAFQKYMESGGAWLGFHVAAYNDEHSNWPWFVDFLGGGVFHSNSWPPLPARLTVHDPEHPATLRLPASFLSPDNEWYIWKPSPRLNNDVRVLVTLDPSNYPIGFKDVLTGGDLPVVWTNTRYKMLYMNMGHGDKIFRSLVQNRLIEDATLWLGAMNKKEISAKGSAIRPPSFRSDGSLDPCFTLPRSSRGSSAQIPAQPEMPAGTLISPHAVVFNPNTNKVYAVNSRDSTVMVVNTPAGSTKSVRVGAQPVAIAVNTVTNKIYVANSGSGTVSVIDGGTDAVTATINVGPLPYVIAANPATNKIYISKTFSNTMVVIDGATNVTSHLKPGIQADALAINPVTNKLYLTNYESPNVTVMDGATHDTISVAGKMHAWAIALNPRTNKIYVANAGSSNLTVIEGATHAASKVKTGDIPCAVAVDSAANRIYVVNYGGDTVTVLDGASSSVLATVAVGAGPQAIAVNPATHTIYVANTRSNSVTTVDGPNNSVVATTLAGNGPYAIAVDTTANKAYVANIEGTSLTVIDGHEAKTAASKSEAVRP